MMLTRLLLLSALCLTGCYQGACRMCNDCKVRISTDFTHEETVSILNAVSRWEATGAIQCEVVIGGDNPTIHRQPYKEGGYYGYHRGNGEIDLFVPLPDHVDFEATALHEFGHAFGWLGNSHHDEVGVMAFGDCISKKDLERVCPECEPEPGCTEEEPNQ